MSVEYNIEPDADNSICCRICGISVSKIIMKIFRQFTTGKGLNGKDCLKDPCYERDTWAAIADHLLFLGHGVQK